MAEVSNDVVSDEAKKSDVVREVVVILDQASLEIVKTRGGDFELLNCDDHLPLMKKHNKDPAKYRPDIAHQVFRL